MSKKTERNMEDHMAYVVINPNCGHVVHASMRRSTDAEAKRELWKTAEDLGVGIELKDSAFVWDNFCRCPQPNNTRQV